MSTPFQNAGLLNIVKQSIETHGIFKRRDSVLIAVSGGADSVVLLDLLVRLQGDYELRLGVIHMDHGLRGQESVADRKFVEEMAEAKGICCYCAIRDVTAYRKKHKLSIEEAARNLRYAFLFETADKQGFTKIATAHHADDNAELVLMNLLRGSGPAGLAGMDAVSRNGRLVRPLLDVHRSDIMAYIETHDLTFREDRTNRDKTFLRNRIRLELLPLIDRSYRKGFSRTLIRTARIIREDDRFLYSCVEPVYEQAVREMTDSKVLLDLSEIQGLHGSLCRRVIRKALLHVKGDLRRIGYVHVDDVICLMNHDTGRVSLDLPGRIRVKVDQGLLSVVREKKNLRQIPPFEDRKALPSFEYSVDKPMEKSVEVDVPEAGLRFRFSRLGGGFPAPEDGSGPDTAFLDLDRLSFPLTIRNTRSGDRFRPLGMTGHKSVSRFFSHGKISRKQRGSVTVLVSGSRIVWVCGYRIDESAKVIPATENTLKVELFLA